MRPPILNHLLPQGILVVINVLTSFLKISSCTFGTGFVREHIEFVSSFNLKSTGSVSQVPSVTLNHCPHLCNNFSNLLCCVIIKWWHWVYITLYKSDFSYLVSNITRNSFGAVRTCSESYTSLTQALINDSSGVISPI